MAKVLKERKFIECFKSSMTGSCNYCKTRTWNLNNKIYAMKKPDGKWLACSDRACYLEQGGTLTLFKGDPLPSDEPISNTGIEDLFWKPNPDQILNFVQTDLIFEAVDELRIRFKGSNTDYLVDTKKLEELFSMIASRKEPIK